MEERICPICGKTYTEYSAISRRDNKTEICPACGMAEAFYDLCNASFICDAGLMGKAEVRTDGKN